MPKITPIDYRTLIKVFELEGFKVSRQRGDHIVMTRPGTPALGSLDGNRFVITALAVSRDG